MVCCICFGMAVISNTVVMAKEDSEKIQLTSERTYVLMEGEESQTDGTTERAGLDASIQAPSAVLMEPSTGTIIYEKNASEQLRPASITKIMTLILIFDAIDDGRIRLEDTVTTSEHAAGMGGSQVFLEVGEQQNVDTMIKCIAVASANDACVAMAEHICGSEEAFVAQMNERAAGLGMENTHFVNCCGLDTDGHVTTAMDVAKMSRELITKYPQIHKYSTIWMENITHHTAKGDKEFGLTNTNKLIKQYQYATGLKTGSTGLAKYCLSATASKDGVNLIAVVMAAPDYKVRFKDAAALLNYGFANCRVYEDEERPKLKALTVTDSLTDEIKLSYQGEFSYLSMNGEDLSRIEKKLVLPKEIKAPLKEGQVVGRLEYRLDDEVLGKVDIVAENSAKKAGFMEYYTTMWKTWAL